MPGLLVWACVLLWPLGSSPQSGALCWFLVRRFCRACCVNAGRGTMVGLPVLILGPLPWPGVLCCCWTPSMVGVGVLLLDPPPWWRVLSWRWVPRSRGLCCASARSAAMVRRAVLVFCSSLWSGVLCWCWVPLHAWA